MKLYKEQCSNERDINSSLIVLLIYGTLYPQQSFLPQVWLFLNEIQPSWRPVAFYVTLNNMCLCILCHVFYCDVSGCLVLLLSINWLIYWIDWLDWLIGLWWYICTRRLYVRTRCSKCSVAVSSTELVMRVKQLVFHTVSPSQLYRFTYLLAYLLAVLLSSGKMVLITSLLVSHSIVKWVTIIFLRFTISPMQVWQRLMFVCC